MTVRKYGVSWVPGMAPNAPKRNLIVLLVYRLGLGIGFSTFVVDCVLAR